MLVCRLEITYEHKLSVQDGALAGLPDPLTFSCVHRLLVEVAKLLEHFTLQPLWTSGRLERYSDVVYEARSSCVIVAHEIIQRNGEGRLADASHPRDAHLIHSAGLQTIQ